MKRAVTAAILMFGSVSVHAGEHNYYATTHKLVSQMRLGDHPEVRGILEGMLNSVPPSAQGYVGHMIRHAPRGPGGDYVYEPATGTWGLE